MMGPELLGQMIDRHAAALVLYARQFCSAPEDVVQEALVKLAAADPVPRNPAAWLYRVVRNGALTAARAEKRRRRHEALAAQPVASWFHDSESIDGETVTRALDFLPPEQREVITLHLWGGLTFEEIAQVSGCSSSTAHRWYVVGLSSLRERLKVDVPTSF